MDLNKAQRLAQTKGVKGWAAMFALLGFMLADQFIIDVPYFNAVFPVLVIAAACMNPLKNAVLVAAYSVLFELGCLAWFPADLLRAQQWLLQVFIGYSMPYIVYKVCNRRHRNMSVLGYAAIASVSELLYFWTSIAATVILWHVEPIAYILSDLPYQFVGCLATYVCTVPVAICYKLTTGELNTGKKLPLFKIYL